MRPREKDNQESILESAEFEPSQPIPNKLYFRIGEVSRLTGVKAYVLRYWESEFHSLGPKKSGTNQRLYRRKDVELVLEIKRLLYEKRFTIEGARKFLDGRGKIAPVIPVAPQATLFASEPEAGPTGKQTLKRIEDIRRELHSILDLLR